MKTFKEYMVEASSAPIKKKQSALNKLLKAQDLESVKWLEGTSGMAKRKVYKPDGKTVKGIEAASFGPMSSGPGNRTEKRIEQIGKWLDKKEGWEYVGGVVKTEDREFKIEFVVNNYPTYMPSADLSSGYKTQWIIPTVVELTR